MKAAGFLFAYGEASLTPMTKEFWITIYAKFQADATAATDLLFGSQGTETSGVLTGRGLRVSFTGTNGITLAVHNGTSETTATATRGYDQDRKFIIHWDGVSTLELYQNGGNSRPILVGSVTASPGGSSAAGYYFMLVGRSTTTSPPYSLTWDIGNVLTYQSSY